jgi:predicted GIY-YIG superfamily endonuclease
MSFWVYILRCSNGSYYTGHTDDLERRVGQHAAGAVPGCYTLNRRPLQSACSQEFSTREEALAAERQIKGWSRAKKEAMLRGEWNEVVRLAKSRTMAPLGSVPEVPLGSSVHPSTGSGRTEDGGRR